MRVRFRRRLQVEGVEYAADEEADLAPETAHALHASGVAEIVTQRLKQPQQNRIRRPKQNRSV